MASELTSLVVTMVSSFHRGRWTTEDNTGAKDRKVYWGDGPRERGSEI